MKPMPAKRGEALRLNPLLTISGQHQTSPSGYACASCDRPCGGFSIYPRGGVSDMSVDKPRPEPKLFNFTRIRRAQGLALVLIPALTAFKPKIEAAIIQESKPVPPDEVMHLLDQLYILGIAGGLILQMVAVLQANQRAELLTNENEKARSLYNSIARQRLGEALRYCNDATYALMKLTRLRTA
jgi:hypothetical protein